jgi:hypothetical protein
MRCQIAMPVFLLLGACGGGTTTGVISYGAAQIEDCRKPVRMDFFSVHAKSIKWTGQKVTITFVVTNQNTQPASFANPSVTGYMGIVLMSLQSANGTKYDPAVSPTPFSGPFSDNLNPGISKEGAVVFEVPPGEYTFHADRSVTYTATVGVAEKHFEPYVCKIPAI